MRARTLIPETVTIIRPSDIERLERLCHKKAEAGMRIGATDEVIFFKATVKMVLRTLGITDAKSLYDPENEARKKAKRKERNNDCF